MRFSFGMRGVNGDLECPRWFGVGRKNIGHDLRTGLFDRDLQIHCGTLEPDVCRGTGLKQRPFSIIF